MAEKKVIEETLNLEQKVTVKSIAGWSVGFSRIDGVGDIAIPPEGRIKLTRGEIIAQTQTDNKLFAGIDGMGSHATLYVDDEATRRELEFESSDGKRKQTILTEDVMKSLFNIKNQSSFQTQFAEAVQTRAEKYAAMQMIKKLGLNDYSKIVFAVKHTGYNL